MQPVELHTEENLRIKRGLLVLKSSSFLIFVGALIIFASFIIMWNTALTATRTKDYTSITVQVPLNGYSLRRVVFDQGWYTHFSFRVEQGNVKYTLLRSSYEYAEWYDGWLSPEWIETPSDFTYWRNGIPHTGSEKIYLFYNEDSQPKIIYFESFMSRIVVNYLYMNSGFLLLVLGAGTLIFGLCRRLQASVNPRLAFVVSWSSYFSILLVSCLLGLFYPFFAPYGLFFVPVVANFWVGYLVKEEDMAIKVILASSFLQAVILLPLLYSSISNVFISRVTISSYYILQVPLGITVSFVGKTVRKNSNEIIALYTYFEKKMKQIIEKLLSVVGK
jgi:hypothetical protein